MGRYARKVTASWLPAHFNFWGFLGESARGENRRSPCDTGPTLASLVSGVAGLRVYRPQNPVDQLAVSRGILEDVPSRERSDQILLRKHTIRRCPPKPLAIHTYRCPSARGNSHHLNPYLKPSSASINGVSDCFTQSFDTICSPSHMPSCR